MDDPVILHRRNHDKQRICEKIRNAGGWPGWATFLVAFETKDVEIATRFCDEKMRSRDKIRWYGQHQYWSIILTADDYYWWAISPQRKREIRRNLVHEFIDKARSSV